MDKMKIADFVRKSNFIHHQYFLCVVLMSFLMAACNLLSGSSTTLPTSNPQTSEVITTELLQTSTASIPLAPTTQPPTETAVTNITPTDSSPTTPPAQPSGSEAPATPPAGTNEYIVQPGDTCIKIAAQFGIPVEQLLEINQLGPECPISVGMQLFIPVSLTTTPPWLIISSPDGYFIVNPDGSATTRLTGLDAIDLTIAPNGIHAALISIGDENGCSLNLKLINLPDGTPQEIISLVKPSDDPCPNPDPDKETQRNTTGWSIIGNGPRRPSLGWSPDGKLLAFVGAMDGNSGDVYTYSIDTGEIKRITSGPAQIAGLSWSPDGQFIINFGANGFGGAGDDMVGAWAARVDGSNVIDLYQPDSRYEEVLGWTSSSTLIVDSWGNGCIGNKVAEVDLKTFKLKNLNGGCAVGMTYNTPAFDPASGSVMFSVNDQCPCSFQPGIYLLQKGQTTPQQIVPFDAWFYWSPEANSFFIQDSNNYLSAYTPQGIRTNLLDIADMPADLVGYPPIASAASGYAAIAPKMDPADQGLIWVGKHGETGKQIFHRTAGSLLWSQDGLTLFFTADQNIYAARAPEFNPEITGQIPAQIIQLYWSMP